MIMISGIIITTQSKNITLPRKYLNNPSTNMHEVPKICYEILIYTNCEVDDIDLEDGDDMVKTHPYA
jgi:hypothetical protein